MTKIKVDERALEALVTGPATWQYLERVARTVAARVEAPSHLRVWVKRGDGPRGPFAQVIMEGQGAPAIEFGTRTRPPNAPLRRALWGGR